MLRRKMYDALLEWKGRKHKCLTLKGQRQVGKTYIVDMFGTNEYQSYVKVDLSNDVRARAVFEKEHDVDSIVMGLEVVLGRSIAPGSLIFLDEMQECPEVRSALKQFSIDGRYDVIASGSLLGIDTIRGGPGRKPLLPAGYEEHMTMHSLDFEEFLWANGMAEDSISYIRGCIRDRRPFNDGVLEKVSSLFRDFMIVGGMPEAVQSYIDTRSYSGPAKILDDILATCRNDINRYNEGIEVVKTMQCFDSIPAQLSDTNKKFMFSRITDEPVRKSYGRFMENLLWIEYAGYGNFCHMVDAPVTPLTGHIVPDAFKVYMSDTGMLVRMFGGDTAMSIRSEDYSYNNGAIVENEVAECLMKAGVVPLTYRKTNGDDRMELDFVTVMGMKVAVIEVKSGRNRASRSMEKVASVFDIGRRIVFEQGNISVDEGGLEHYPLFAAAFIADIRGDETEITFRSSRHRMF